jgi:hypothetical protein
MFRQIDEESKRALATIANFVPNLRVDREMNIFLSSALKNNHLSANSEQLQCSPISGLLRSARKDESKSTPLQCCHKLKIIKPTN